MIFHVRKPQKSTKIGTKSRSERGFAKKRLRKPIFHDFWWILGSPGTPEIGQGAPRNRQKALRSCPEKNNFRAFSILFTKNAVTKGKGGLRGPPGSDFHRILVDFCQILDDFLLNFCLIFASFSAGYQSLQSFAGVAACAGEMPVHTLSLQIQLTGDPSGVRRSREAI